jgi:type I restriction enzyme R subunit
MNEIDQSEKTIVFCRTQKHAGLIRIFINQIKKSKEPNYCVRVTADDGELGEQYLREFQNNDRSVPTILTTSQKLSTGVDARNIRNIVLLRPVKNIIEFKQIVGRGTRTFEGKDYFTIYDFVKAYEHFKDPEWDGEPEDPVPTEPRPSQSPIDAGEPDVDYEPDEKKPKRKMIKVKLRDGKEHEITHDITSSFFDVTGKPISMQEFLNSLFGKFPELFKNEAELRRIWSDPSTRKELLAQLDEAGFDKEQLHNLQKAVDAEKSDLFDVLEFISYSIKPITRAERVMLSKGSVFKGLQPNQKEFIEFVLSQYIETGVEELDEEKLPALLMLKYQSLPDAIDTLGDVDDIRNIFSAFQKYLYQLKNAS